MLQSPKSGKNRREEKCHICNILNSNNLQTSLKIRVFATNFAVGCFYASYERHFVKKIQHLFSLNKAVHDQIYQRYFMIGFHWRIMAITETKNRLFFTITPFLWRNLQFLWCEITDTNVCVVNKNIYLCKLNKYTS